MASDNDNMRSAGESVVRARDLGRILLQGAPIALAAMIIGGIGAYLYSSRQMPTYQATATLLSSVTNTVLGGIELAVPSQVDSRVYQRAVYDGPVLARTIASVSGHPASSATLASLRGRVGVEIEDHRPLSSIVRISVRSTDAEIAALYANTIAEQLIAWDRGRAERSLEEAIVAIEAAIVEVDAEIVRSVELEPTADAQRIQALNATRRDQLVRELDFARSRRATAVVVSSLTQLRVAGDEENLVGPRTVLNTLVASVATLVMAYALQILYWSNRRQVVTPARLKSLTPIPFFGGLSHEKRSSVGGRGSLALARTGLLSSTPNSSQVRVYGVTSPSSFDEKWNVAIGLAYSFAQAGYRTLVIDGDLEKLAPDYALGLSGTDYSSLEDVLRDPTAPPVTATISFDSNVKADVLPLRQRVTLSTPELQVRFPQALKALAARYDVVLIDIAPLLVSSRAIITTGIADANVVVVGARTDVRKIGEAFGLLELADVALAGTILTSSDWSLRFTSGKTGRGSNATEFHSGARGNDRVPMRKAKARVTKLQQKPRA